MTNREHVTVLAALRYWQWQTQEAERHEVMPDHFFGIKPLTDEEIDDLCETLTSGPRKVTP